MQAFAEGTPCFQPEPSPQLRLAGALCRGAEFLPRLARRRGGGTRAPAGIWINVETDRKELNGCEIMAH